MDTNFKQQLQVYYTLIPAAVRTHWRRNPYETFALSTFLLILLGTFLTQPSTFYLTTDNISVLAFKTLCATLVVCLACNLLVYYSSIDWTHSSARQEDHPIEYEKETPTSTPNRSCTDAMYSPRVPELVIPPTPQLPSAMRNSRALDTSRAEVRSFTPLQRPTHESGIMGPSPYPQRGLNSRDGQGSGGSTSSSQDLFRGEASTGHLGGLEYNGSPVTAGYRHFSGLGFAREREKVRGLRMGREFSRVEDVRDKDV
jgi:hypothetical protein